MTITITDKDGKIFKEDGFQYLTNDKGHIVNAYQYPISNNVCRKYPAYEHCDPLDILISRGDM